MVIVNYTTVELRLYLLLSRANTCTDILNCTAVNMEINYYTIVLCLLESWVPIFQPLQIPNHGCLRAYLEPSPDTLPYRGSFHIIFIINISILDYLNTLVRISAEFHTPCVRMASMSHTYMCNFVFCLYFLLF